MRLVSVASEKLSQTLALIGAIGIILMMIHIGADILSRNLFGRPIPATNEIVSRYYMVFIAFLPLAWVERRRGMVSVEVVEALMGPRMIRGSDLIVVFLATLIYALLAYTTWFDALSAYRAGRSVIALNILIPVWPTFFLPPIGFTLAAIVTLVRGYEIVTGTEPPREEEPPE